VQTDKRAAIEWVPLSVIALNPQNPRLNDGEPVEAVKASIARFGFRVPIVVNRRTGLIEAGNTRYKAAVELGLSEVPVIWVDDDEITATAYGIADNKTAEFAQWDDSSLASLLQSLQEVGQLEATGYDAEGLAELLAEIEAANPAPVPEEGTSSTPPERWLVIVECAGESEQLARLQHLSEMGWECRAAIS